MNLKRCLSRLERGEKAIVEGDKDIIEEEANLYGWNCKPEKRKYTVRLQKDGTLALWRHDYFGK